MTSAIKADIDTFLAKMPNETINLKDLGVQSRTLHSIIDLYANLYICGGIHT